MTLIRPQRFIEELLAFSSSLGHGGRLTREVLESVYTSGRFNDFHRQIALWLYMGKGSVFIQDANSFVLPAPVLVEAIGHLKQKIPGIGRITSYARSSTIAKMSVAELAEIRQAGLDRIHIGMESGSDRVLEFVQKGVSARRQIEAGRKVIEAGMELSEYFMPGLGGKELSEDHARESARVLNEINPHFIRLRTLRIPPRVPLFQDKQSGRFTPLSDDETVLEIRLFISFARCGFEPAHIGPHNEPARRSRRKAAGRQRSDARGDRPLPGTASGGKAPVPAGTPWRGFEVPR